MLNVLFVAWDVLVPKFAAEEWENFREERFRTDPSFNHRQCWREIVARPSNAAEAREVLTEAVKIPGPLQAMSQDLLNKVNGTRAKGK